MLSLWQELKVTRDVDFGVSVLWEFAGRECVYLWLDPKGGGGGGGWGGVLISAQHHHCSLKPA